MGAKKSKKVFTRPQTRRVRAILQRVREGNYPNCNSLAKELEVKPRTIHRDISDMKNFMNIPIEYDRRRYGFYLDGPVGEAPWLTINQGELIALILAEKALDEFAGTTFEQPLHSAMQKLAESLDGSISFKQDELDSIVSFHDVHMGRGYLPVFHTVSDALNKRLEIAFSYLKPQAVKRELRRVRPYHLACIKRQWYLLAYDLLRQDIRTFVLARMKKVTATETRFTIPRDFSIKKHLSGSFGVHSATGDYQVKIRFTGLAAALVREKKWHPSQKIISISKRLIELRLHLTSLEEIESWVLGWGPEAKVLEPVDFRERIVEKIQKMGLNYV